MPSSKWNDVANRLEFLQNLGKRLGFRKPDDWYSIRHTDFSQNGGLGLVCYYGGSPSAVVMDNLPNDWKPWLFAKAPRGLWDDPNNRQLYMKWLGSQLGYSSPDDWYRVRQADFLSHRGSHFLNFYKGSPFAAVKEFLCEFECLEWCMQDAPKGFWQKQCNRLRYMRWLQQKLGISGPTDWYNVSPKDFANNHGSGFLWSQHKASVYSAIQEYLPDHDWKVWLFKNAPKNVWNRRETQLGYLRWLADKIGVREPKDWYRIRQSDFKRNKGHQLLKFYNNSAFQIVMKLIPPPEEGWIEWLFFRAPQTFWEKKTNRLRFISWLENELGIRKPEDWYSVTQYDFEHHRGAALIMTYYGGSPAAALKEYRPDYQWIPWLFYRVSSQFWHSMKNRRDYFAWLQTRLGYESQDDWYRISRKDINENCGAGLLANYYNGSPAAAVSDCVPGNWEPEKFSSQLKSQKKLFNAVRKLFPGERIIWNYKHDGIRFPDSDRKMELDIFLPLRMLAFEYQGEQHFMAIKRWGGDEKLQLIRRRDAFKREACRKLGITLIEASYEWNGSIEAIEELVANQPVVSAALVNPQ